MEEPNQASERWSALRCEREVYRFEGFELELFPGELRHHGRTIALTTKSLVALKTMPVGLNAAPAVLGAKLTTSGAAVGCALPLPSYCVAVALRLLATQIAVVGPKAMPQGLTRCASVLSAAVPEVSATRFVTVKAADGVTVNVADFATPAAPAALQVSVNVSAPTAAGVCTLLPDTD